MRLQRYGSQNGTPLRGSRYRPRYVLPEDKLQTQYRKMGPFLLPSFLMRSIIPAKLPRSAQIDVPAEPITAAALSPTANQVATLNEEMDVQLWDSQPGALLSDIGSHDLPGFGLDFSPDGTQLVSGGGFQVKFWD